MPELVAAEALMNNIRDTFSDGASKHKNMMFFEEDKSSSVSSQFNRLFGREKPVHRILGGGKPADVLLWRNKKISVSVLASATVVWVLFEWLNYNLLTLVSFSLVVGMLAQFFWRNASVVFNRSPSKVPRLVLPEEAFIKVGKSLACEANRGLRFLQDVACGGNVKQFLGVVASLLAAAVIGSWCNFLTVLYIGFVAAHTLPVLYERNEDKVDGFVYNVLERLQQQYRKLDSSILDRIPKGKFKAKKFE